jgi:tetratricopeptide (TPR) repeat protein
MSEQVISAIGGAFIGAILAAISAWWIHRSQQVSTLREELRNVLIALLNLRDEERNTSSSLADARERDWWLQQLNHKRILYVDAAEALVNKIRSGVLRQDVSSVEYGMLAEESYADGDYSRAEEYARRAIKASRSKARKVVAYRILAEFYFRFSQIQDFDAGRRHYQEAVDLMKGATDDYSRYLQGYTYQCWGLDELGSGFEAEGMQKIDLARERYRSLSDDPTNFKHNLLEWLDLALEERLRYSAQEPKITNPHASFERGVPNPRGHSTEQSVQPTSESSEDTQQNTR